MDVHAIRRKREEITEDGKKRRNKEDNIKAFGEAGLGEPPRDRMERIACIVFSSL